MGIQDRDYYREKTRKRLEEESRQENRKRQKKGPNPPIQRQDVLMAILQIVALWYFADKIYYQMQERRQEIKFRPETLPPRQAPQNETDQAEPIPSDLTLEADRQGHYWGTALPQEPQQDNTGQSGRSELIPGGLILKADRQGHYRGTVLINNPSRTAHRKDSAVINRQRFRLFPIDPN